MKPIEDCNVAIVGLGMMGGAIARSLKKNNIVWSAGRILAYDINTEVLDAALNDKFIDASFTKPEAMLTDADLVILCLNPQTLITFMREQMANFRENSIITDVAGVKSSIITEIEARLRADLDFIPGHPMAGSEKGGYFNSMHTDFHNKNYILTPLKRNRPENLEFIKDLIYRMGFSRITETTADEHDRKIAFTSQLCHVIAAALIDCESDTEITNFGGGSFEDLTRIAMLNVPMWTELFLENKKNLNKRIEQFEQSLSKMKKLIADNDKHELIECLGHVSERRATMQQNSRSAL